jgi:hypothetical protein
MWRIQDLGVQAKKIQEITTSYTRNYWIITNTCAYTYIHGSLLLYTKPDLSRCLLTPPVNLNLLLLG